MGVLLAKALAIAVIVHGPCPTLTAPNVVACTVPPATTYIRVNPPSGTLEHELGHVIDFNLLTNADRGRFIAYVRQLDLWYVPRSARQPRGWWESANPPAEKFAEAVRMCARSMRFPTNWANYDWTPSTALHRRVCRWLASLG